jgi:genome maintenance exonuclease 1
MLITNPYCYEALERSTQPTGERVYVTPFGALPSVTTILSSTSDNAGLAAWREFVGEARANQIRDEATGLGSLMHEHLECHIQNIERPRGSNLVRQMARKMADVIINGGLKDMDEIWGIESPLYYPGKWAGTTDLVGVYKGKPAICDYKTASKMKTADMITDYFLQGCAYALAHNVLYGTDIRSVVIFMVSRDLQHKVFVIQDEEFDKYLAMWEKRVELYYEKFPPASTE